MGSGWKRDVLIALAIALVSAAIRVPRLDYPAVEVFDEGIYALFLSNDSNRTPYFEIHPPLMRTIYSLALPDEVEPYQRQSGSSHPFGSFPYVPLRMLSAVIGSAIPAFVYAIARSLNVSRSYAVFAGLAATLDPTLISYCRTFLPDTMLWSFGTASVLVSIAASKQRGVAGAALTAAAAFLVGCAVSVKWTGIVFLFPFLVAPAVFAPRLAIGWRIARSAIIGCIVMGSVYAGSWALYAKISASGYTAYDTSFYLGVDHGFRNIHSGGILDYVRFSIDHALFATALQRTDTINEAIDLYGEQWKWPLGIDTIGAMANGMWTERIIFSGNAPLYTAASCAILFLAFLLAKRLREGHSIEQDREQVFLLCSYAAATTVVMAMSMVRPLFLYHYVPSYLISLIALAVLLEHLSRTQRYVGVVARRGVVFIATAYLGLQTHLIYGL